MRRMLPKAGTVRTLVVAAGGFSVGSLLMAAGLTVGGSPLTGDRISLQDDAGDLSVQVQAAPTSQSSAPALAAAAPAAVVEQPTKPTGTSATRTVKPTATRSTRSTHRAVVAAAPRKIVKPPKVNSAGS